MTGPFDCTKVTRVAADHRCAQVPRSSRTSRLPYNHPIHTDVIKRADWVIDLGPEAGDAGGRVVVQGTPEQVAACEASHTGKYLKKALGSSP